MSELQQRAEMQVSLLIKRVVGPALVSYDLDSCFDFVDYKDYKTWYLIACADAANKSQIWIWLGNDDLDASAKNLVVLAEVSQGKNAIINATVM